ncbi:oligosaccharide repeat unit polymerase [Muribaculum sp. NM65_B17]|nr:oligosaccharide repeat unit polymerase [Muribaculum sp. NM65_B17]THG44647.1 oligosaccharide repeat unit polymerase [Muribaculaceae bacterium]
MPKLYKYNALRSIFIFFNAFIFVMAIYAIMIASPGKYKSDAVYLSNAAIIIYSLLHILSNENKAYSAKKIFYLFIFFFMGIAPLMQFKMGTETVGGYKISEDTYIITNLITLLMLFIYDLTYNYSYKHINKPILTLDKTPVSVKKIKKWRAILLGISIVSVAYTIFYFRNNLYLLIFRGLSDIVGDDVSQKSGNFTGPLFDCIIRPLSVVCCINYWAIGKSKTYKFYFFILMLISCFPISLARLRTAAYYMPLLILAFPKIRYNNRFIFLFLIGFLVIFPLLNNFRTWSNGSFEFSNLDFNMFCNMNYDSYQSFAFVVQNGIVTYGRQLLVVLFFWIPRSIWPDKPYMSGRWVAHEHDLWFDQISMNYFGEGFINGGILGVIVFTIFLAFITAKFDKSYWIFYKGSPNNLFAPFFLLFIGMYFFFMRGDLMYGTQYTICLLGTNFLIYKISRHYLK